MTSEAEKFAPVTTSKGRSQRCGLALACGAVEMIRAGRYRGETLEDIERRAQSHPSSTEPNVWRMALDGEDDVP